MTLTPELAAVILQFLARTQINGNEAPALMECVMALKLIAQVGKQPDVVNSAAVEPSKPAKNLN